MAISSVTAFKRTFCLLEAASAGGSNNRTTAMETRSAKRRKLLFLECSAMMTTTLTVQPGGRGEGEEGGADLISNLPDDVLFRILDLLSIETIARMSLLSKRWARIWQSFPDLDFTSVRLKSADHAESIRNLIRSKCRRFSFDRQRVQNFLYLYDCDFISNVLSLRSKAGSDIRTLRFGAYVSLTHLNKLIRQALRWNARELDVEFATEDYFNVPKCVISSESLQALSLKSQFPGFRLPYLSIMNGGGFRSLQVLSLSLMLTEGDLDIFKDSAFPVLRKLYLCECHDLRRIRVNCSLLEDMTLEKCFILETLEVRGARLERLRVANCFYSVREKSFVKIDAPRLRVVEWEKNYLTEDCSLQNLKALRQASLHFLKLHEVVPAIYLSAVRNFLHGLSHVRCLILDTLCMKLLTQKNLGPLLPFINLECLELRTFLTHSIIPALHFLLKSSPSLHTLILNITDHCGHSRNERKMQDKDLLNTTYSEEEKHWETEMSVMALFLENLKVVKIRGFMGCKAEVGLAKFLLRHGKALEEMVLCSFNRDALHKDRNKSQILSYSGSASNAKISFEYDFDAVPKIRI
ncbi:hypothetical protein SAY86_010925 [Trapa natans]|uniref:F-box domain-containing protein n=1 Tax=Trapa natans TaxID=22666 RepID=A0AAN7LHZ8_TRANT|nr:hypothetical protein SAY86_010925 [Trapa natans]